MKIREVGSRFGLVARDPIEELLETLYEDLNYTNAAKSRAEELHRDNHKSDDLAHDVGEATGRSNLLREVIRELEGILK